MILLLIVETVTPSHYNFYPSLTCRGIDTLRSLTVRTKTHILKVRPCVLNFTETSPPTLHILFQTCLLRLVILLRFLSQLMKVSVIFNKYLPL